MKGPQKRESDRRRLRITVTVLLIFLLAVFAAADPVTIRYACASGGDNLKSLRRMVALFESKHPDIRIKVEPIVADNYENKLLANYAANISADVANLNPNRFRVFAQRGALLPLNTFPDLSGPEANIAGRYQNYVKAFTYEGKLYCIPRDVACSSYIFYNRRLFREAGIPEPDGSWTWDTHPRPELKEKDFIWVMQRLTKVPPGEKRPTQYGFTSSWPQLWMTTLLQSSNVRMWDSDEDPKQLFLDRPENVEIFQFASDCINRYHWIPSNNDVSLGSGSTMQQEFYKGRIAMLESGAWEIKDLRTKMKDEWDIAPFPRFARGKESFLPGEGNGLAIFKTTPHPKEAWEWVKFFCGPEALTEMARTGESQPSIRELCRVPGIWLPAKDAVGPNQEPAHLAITDDIVPRVHFVQTPDWFEGIANDLQGNYYGVLAGENSAQNALGNLQRNEPNKLALARRRNAASPYPFGAGLAVGIALTAALIAWIYLPERGKRRTKSERAENRTAYLFLIPWIVGLAFTFGPMIYSLLLSFSDSDIIQTPNWRGLDNYADALNPAIDDTLWVSLRQTFIFSAISIPIGLAASFGLSLLLNQKVKGIPIFRALFYLPSLASAVAMSLIWMRLFDKDRGIINLFLYGADGKSGFLHIGPVLSNLLGTPGEAINWLGNTRTVIPAFIIMGLWGAGGGTIMFLAGLQGIEPSYYEAATLDGAGAWRKFRSVTVPMMTPYLFFALITGIIGALQVFGQSFVMTGGGPDRATLFYVVWLFGKAFSELKMGYASALAWILFVVIMAFTVVQLRLSKRWVFYEGDLK